MKLIDRVIRYWRVKVALRHVQSNIGSVFDIGCDDGFLLRQFVRSGVRKVGVDPRLKADCVEDDHVKLCKGCFPSCIEACQMQGPYDVVLGLAVFEHFSDEDINRSADAIPKILSPKGRLIVTVPHPLVDKILDILMFFRLIDGQATEEHHGLDPDDLVERFSKTMKLITREQFQFGLNNVFVFEKYE